MYMCAFVVECQCDVGFSSSVPGQACDISPTCSDIGECLNGGSCVIDGVSGAAYCNCPVGVTGTNCESRPCLDQNVDCHGNGRCEILASGDPYCVCDQDRYQHSGGADATPGDCANTQCGDNLVCQHGGTCVANDYRTEFSCSCPYPYTGNECQTYEICNINPCVNGECHTELVAGTDSHCDCNDNYHIDPDTGFCTRHECATDVDFCMHGGTCTSDETGCQCPEGVFGDHCEDVDYCYQQECGGHGACYEVATGSDPDTMTDFACDCETGWIGRECDRMMCIGGVTCMNGATCTTDGCVCATGFAGDSCEIRLTDDCVDYPCLNGGYCDNRNGAGWFKQNYLHTSIAQ